MRSQTQSELLGTHTELHTFDQQDASFAQTRPSASHSRTVCDRLIAACLSCALHPCAGLLRRCGWLPASAQSDDGDDLFGSGTGGGQWEPNMGDYEVLRLDEMEPAAPAVAAAMTSQYTASSSGRGYAPPRPSLNTMRTPPPQPQAGRLLDTQPAAGGGKLVCGVNAASSSSLIETEPSSTFSSAHQRTVGDRWVMQRGVLVKIGADGVRTVETFAPTNSRTRGRPSPRSMEANMDTTGSSASKRSMAAAAIIEELEGLRQPISRLSELTTILERCCRHLPLRIEVAADHAAVAQGTDGALPFTLQILGPLQRSVDSLTLSAEALTVVEDILLDDCLEDNLRLSCLHICDLSLAQSTTGMNPIDPTDPTGLGSNAFLDMLLSPTGGPQYKPPHRSPCPAPQSRNDGKSDRSTSPRDDQENDASDHGGNTGTDRGTVSSTSAAGAPMRPSEALRRECESRLSVLLKNMLESRARDLATLHFTRCVFSPLSIGDVLSPSLPHLRRLLFEQCPFSTAHVDAILRTAHVLTRRVGTGPSAHVAFGALQELQLCGALSPDAIQDVLRFFAEEVPFKGTPCLHIVRLPFSLARAAREHPFVIANPTLKVEACA